MRQRAALVAFGFVFAIAVGYNVWTWRQSAAPVSSAPAANVAAPESPTTQSGSVADALAPAPVAPAPLTATSVEWPGDGGSIEAQLAAAVDADHAAAPAAVEFDETADAIFVALKSTLPAQAGVHVIWRRLPNGAIPGDDIYDTTVVIPAGQRRSGTIRRPSRGGFLPGNYELEISIGNINPKALPFRVTSKYVDARPIVSADGVPGMNVALAALGGRIASSSAGLKSAPWVVDNLIDGFPFRMGGSGCDICGWTSGNDLGPHEIVFALAGDAPIVIDAIVIDPSTGETAKGEQWNVIPRNVEVLASATSPTDGFSTIGTARIQPRPIEQLIQVPATPARFIKLRLLSNWSGNTTQLAEVKVLEASGRFALEKSPRNIALPALGGVVARFSSQDDVRNGVQQLIDNASADPWISADGYLPQDFVFAFKDDQVARIESIVLRAGGRAPETFPKKVLVSVSTDSLFDFADVGQFDVAKDETDHALPVQRDARFVRVRILENHGGRDTSLNEIRVLEGSGTGYVSVLARTAPLVSPAAAAAEAALARADADEKESNNEPPAANPLKAGSSMRATIDPLGESDHFAIDVPGGNRQMLNLALTAPPFIKTSVSLLDASGAETKRFDPAQAAEASATISWLVEPGRQTIRVAEPPASIVLVWDTSGSMEGTTDALREAVLAYLSRVRPTEKLNLIRFSDEVEVLLPEFTSDIDVLRAAATTEKFYPDGGTRFYDAVERAVALLSRQTGNRAIIVLSDGEDSLSQLSAPRFWSLLQQERVRLYSIGLGVALKGFATRIGSTGQRFMGHASYVTNGRSFFARDTSELKPLYDRIAAELRVVSRYTLTPSIGAATGTISVAATGERLAAVAAPSRVQLVLDASGSMNRRIGNKRMIDAAKDVLSSVVTALPDEVHVGLRVYGHRIKEGQRGACEDSQQVSPIARLDRPRLLQRIRSINALGTTPIAYSLQQVAADLAGAEGPQMVVLVTDGREECGGDPKAAIESLRATGLKVRVNIVGFALTDAVAQKQLTEAAALTGGTYVNAKDDATLKAALDDALRVPYEVRDSAGAVVAAGRVGDQALAVPEGHYTIAVQTAEREILVKDVRVTATKESRIELKKEGREVGVKVNQP